jgi:spermidine synthase
VPVPPGPLSLLVLAYGAATLAGQVLILREILVLAQGQELKLALGLWSWLFWTGWGSLLGGWLAGRFNLGPAALANLLTLLAWLLPVTLYAARGLPSLAPQAVGQSLPPLTALLMFLALLAPFCLVSGAFFPWAAGARRQLGDLGAAGWAYALESLGAALGVGLLHMFLWGQIPALSLGLGTGVVLAAVAWILAKREGIPGRLFKAATLIVLGLGLCFSPVLEDLSRKIQWPGRRVAAARDSPYALLTATREAEQVSFYANRAWLFSHPDPYSAEMAVHLGLLQHPQPKEVLFLGGDPAGLIFEARKHRGLTRLDYVELDPDLVRLVKQLVPEVAGLPAGETGVRLIFQDARRFLTWAPEPYDVILMNLPEPGSAQLNRYYSREFFAIVARRLKPGGVFSFSLSGGETALRPLRAAYLALSYHTLKEVFPEVLIFPGERVRFFASANPGLLTRDPRILVQRVAARGLNLRYLREYYLLTDLSLARQAYLTEILNRQPREVNLDLFPKSYLYDLALTGAREGWPLGEFLLALRSLPAFPWLTLLFLWVALSWWYFRGPSSGVYLTQVFVMGLGAMALEVLVLVLCQIHLGLLYRQLGLLIGAFMAGMGAGGAIGVRLAARAGILRRGLLVCQGGLGLLALILALGLPLLDGSALISSQVFLLGLYLVILWAAGFAGGGVFSLASRLWLQERPASGFRDGLFYAVDLLGATLGSLGLSLVVLPVWGVIAGLLTVAGAHLWAVSLMLLNRQAS